MKYEQTAKRLLLALSNSNMKPQELADKSGVSKASISQYVNGSHSPSNISSGKMGAILNVNPLWLMGFDVPMQPEYEYANGQHSTKNGYYLNNDTAQVAQEIYENDKVLFDVYRSADKDRLIEYAKRLKALRDLEEGN